MIYVILGIIIRKIVLFLVFFDSFVLNEFLCFKLDIIVFFLIFATLVVYKTHKL